MKRRTFITGFASTTVAATAGCISIGDGDGTGGESDGGASDSTEMSTSNASLEPSNEAQASKPGATTLKELLADEYSDVRVFVAQDGAVTVSYKSEASNGPALKDEFKQIMLVYADVLTGHPDTGGLNIHSGGVTALVSRDAALAYANGDIQQSAYFETLAVEGSTDEQE